MTKVRRGDRKLLGCTRAYGRLCQECIDELLATPSDPVRTEISDAGKRKAIRDSDVA